LGDAGAVFWMDAGRLSVYGLNGSERMAFLRLFGGWFLSLRLQLDRPPGKRDFAVSAFEPLPLGVSGTQEFVVAGLGSTPASGRLA
jgi:hypothetical protein